MRPASYGWILALGITVCGCNLRQTPPIAYQRQRLEDVSYRTVFNAAEEALQRYFVVETRDADTGTLRARPVETKLDPSGTRIISDAVGGSRTGRQLAEMRVQQEGPDVDVSCRVLIQELETEKFRLAERQRGVYDQPTDTPAEVEAGTTSEQNAVWVNRSRNRELERRILEAVEQLANAEKSGP